MRIKRECQITKGILCQAEMVRLYPEESLAVFRYFRKTAITKVWKSD